MNSKEDFKAVKRFIEHNYRHFNAAVVKDASQAFVDHLKKGGKMFLAMAGAMSTAELGLTLAEMIRQGKIHGVSCTGANLEEDLFNLIAHDSYERVPHYRYLSKEDEVALRDKRLPRVTDTCIPEEQAMLVLEKYLDDVWKKAEQEGRRHFPYEYFYQVIRSGVLEKHYQTDPANSWVLAACEKNIPIFVGGWEDSTIGNSFVGSIRLGIVNDIGLIKSGLETMHFLTDWYLETSKDSSIGFFQIGGGISGDFPICVVPHIKLDLKKECPCWGYFCQISDSTTSYGSYSGAVPNEKITWNKLEKDTPSFVIESDATIVAPLIFSYVLAED